MSHGLELVCRAVVSAAFVVGTVLTLHCSQVPRASAEGKALLVLCCNLSYLILAHEQMDINCLKVHFKCKIRAWF